MKMFTVIIMILYYNRNNIVTDEIGDKKTKTKIMTRIIIAMILTATKLKSQLDQ